MRIHQALRGHDFFFAGTVSVGDVGRLAVQNNWGDLNNLMSPGHRGHARPGAAWGGRENAETGDRPSGQPGIPGSGNSFLSPLGFGPGRGAGGKVWNLFTF